MVPIDASLLVLSMVCASQTCPGCNKDDVPIRAFTCPACKHDFPQKEKKSAKKEQKHEHKDERAGASLFSESEFEKQIDLSKVTDWTSQRPIRFARIASTYRG